MGQVAVPRPVPLPTSAGLEQVLCDLADDSVRVETTPAEPLAAEWHGLVATLVRDDGLPAAALLIDAALAHRLVLARRRRPPDGERRPRLTDESRQQARDCVEAIVEYLRSSESVSVRIDGTAELPGSLARATQAMLDGPYARRAYQVSFGEQTPGVLTAVNW